MKQDAQIELTVIDPELKQFESIEALKIVTSRSKRTIAH